MSILQTTAVDPKHTTIAGSASVMCLMTVCVILAAGTAVLSVMTAKQAAARRAADVDQAFLMAEAGVDLALSEVRNETDYDVDGIGVVSGASGRGTFTVTLEPAYAGAGDYTIVSTGRVNSVSRTIDVEIGQQVTRAGFLADGLINMSGGIVDSYDSLAGTYLSQVSGTHAGNDVVIRSNANINVGGQIYGDAMPGPTGTVSNPGNVTGSTAPAAAVQPLDPYTYAPPIASMGALSSSTVFTSGQYRYTTFTISGGKFAQFSGDVELWVDGNFTISGSGYGLLNPGARLTIHHGSGNFTISGGGVINQDLRPSNLAVKSATTSAVTISGSASFFGTMLAPNAPLTASGGAGIYGAMQVRTMSLTGGMSLHYDNALGAGSELQVDLLRPRGRTARKS